MVLGPGTRIGPYEVIAQIGVGGMGEVYRATDTNLKRSVAIKVLPASVAEDASRLARFQREAEVLAALNHPNIAAIYGLERSGTTTALVMELVDGLTLADRIAEGAVPLDDVLAIATQLAEALEAAHDQGIVHRDLKPANIKLRPDGRVKVLDFGLAKAMSPPEGGHYVPGGGPDGRGVRLQPDLSQAATITSPAMTQMGMILGTAAYMAPEQASGRPVDKRADIWAFGVVLAEMLTSRRVFDGETVSHVLAAVLTKEPDLTRVPASVRPLLLRCLEKDPRKRLRDIGDAMSLVHGVEHVPTSAVTVAERSAVPRWRSLAGWALAGALAAALAVVVWRRPTPVVEAEAPPVSFQIERAPDVYNRMAGAFAVSPDGQRLVYYGPGPDGPQTLLVRELASAKFQAVPGSASAVPSRSPIFWSPDSRQFVRSAATGADVFDTTNGTTRRLCECRYQGGTWGPDGTILLGAFGDARGIRRLSLTSPTATAVTTPDATKGEVDTSPAFLSDGRRFLFTRSTAGEGPSTYIGSLDGRPPTRLTEGSYRFVARAAESRPAYLVGIDPSGLVARAFDTSTMSVMGPTITVVPGTSEASLSENGVLATSAPGSRPRTIPTWFDRAGTSLGTVGPEGLIEGLGLSPDGRKVVASWASEDPAQPRVDVWLNDLASGARTRVTFEGASTPVWSPDGRRIAFVSGVDERGGRGGRGVDAGGGLRPYHRAADGTGAVAPLFPTELPAWPNDWSSDGRWVIYSTPSAGPIGNDLWAVAMEGTERKPVPYLVGPALTQQAQFSPDGRFVAYGSDQSGTWEIYVQPFPSASEGKWLVSSGGGVEPRWSRDGKELFYFSGQTLMVVPVNLRPTFSKGTPVALFDAPVQPGYTSDSHRWQLAPDGKRFLLLANAGTNQAQPLDVFVNWPALLKK